MTSIMRMRPSAGSVVGQASSLARGPGASEDACPTTRGPSGLSLAVQLPVLDPVRLLGVDAQALLALGLVHLVVALAPDRLAVALERQDVRRDAVQEPAVVADHHRTAAELQP